MKLNKSADGKKSEIIIIVHSQFTEQPPGLVGKSASGEGIVIGEAPEGIA